MSRPKYWWYGQVRKAIMSYDTLSRDESEMSKRFVEAIDEALAETKALPNGEERIRAVEDILIKQIRTIEGEEGELYYSWRTIQNWLNAFINLVGRKVGF